MSEPQSEAPQVLKFTIKGEAASKANSRQIVTIGGRPSSIKSSKARSFEHFAQLQIPAHARRMIRGPVAVELRMFYATNRPDLDESIVLDVMQTKFTGKAPRREVARAGVYLNDRQVIEKHVFKAIDRQNPRVEVSVRELEPAQFFIA